MDISYKSFKSYMYERDDMREMVFFGSATVGERGQIVIPAEARAAFKLEKGEKLLVLGMKDEAIVLQKVSAIRQMSEILERRSKEIKDIMEQI